MIAWQDGPETGDPVAIMIIMAYSAHHAESRMDPNLLIEDFFSWIVYKFR